MQHGDASGITGSAYGGIGLQFAGTGVSGVGVVQPQGVVMIMPPR